MAAYLEDTIAAIATPAGAGAIAILRISGRDACAVARRILRAGPSGRRLAIEPRDSHRARRARLVLPGEPAESVDEVLVLPMLGARSYTGEDTVEIHCHGGRLIADLALRSALAAGARAARPGEFSERAFLNGRLDLCQAEAVADMIAASSEAALALARRQLDGALSRSVAAARDGILDARALVEAHLDFPEEDLPADAEGELLSRIGDVTTALRSLRATYGRGRLARDGLRVVLAGKPNVGKSSLLNALLGRQRALVSEEAGTTRDYLEEPIAFGPYQALVCDTAGIRPGTTEVEQAGVARSTERIEDADVLVLVLDGSRPLDLADQRVFAQIRGRPSVLARNKCDLDPAWVRAGSAFDDRPAVALSALRGTGLDDLVERVLAAVPEAGTPPDGLAVTSARHDEALARALSQLEHATVGLRERGELDLVAADLQEACGALDDLLGRSTSEEVLDRIFRRFCVGK